MRESLVLNRDSAVLVLIDIQERLSAVMPAVVMAQVARNTNILIEAARRMEIPVLVSEQYPQGLGPTVTSVAAGLDAFDKVHRIEKVDFSVCAAEDFASLAEVFKEQGRNQWIVAGMETHICVYQTARSLVTRGEQVQVVSDAVVSRAKLNHKVGLRLAEKAGAAVTSTETVVMDLLARGKGDDFKAISKLIR